MTVELRIPEVGESVTEAIITRWLKAEGDRVEKDEPVAELETDKVDVELPSPASGVIASITAKEGEAVPIGAVIGTIEEGDGAAASATSATRAEEPPAEEEAAGAKGASRPGARAKGTAHEGARSQRTSGQGTGAQGASGKGARAQRASSERGTAQGGPAAGAAPPSRRSPPATRARTADAPGREEEVVPMTAIRRRIAKRLVEAQLETALTTTFNEVDMTAVQELRGQWREDSRSATAFASA